MPRRFTPNSSRALALALAALLVSASTPGCVLTYDVTTRNVDPIRGETKTTETLSGEIRGLEDSAWIVIVKREAELETPITSTLEKTVAYEVTRGLTRSLYADLGDADANPPRSMRTDPLTLLLPFTAILDTAGFVFTAPIIWISGSVAGFDGTKFTRETVTEARPANLVTLQDPRADSASITVVDGTLRVTAEELHEAGFRSSDEWRLFLQAEEGPKGTLEVPAALKEQLAAVGRAEPETRIEPDSAAGSSPPR